MTATALLVGLLSALLAAHLATAVPSTKRLPTPVGPATVHHGTRRSGGRGGGPTETRVIGQGSPPASGARTARPSSRSWTLRVGHAAVAGLLLLLIQPELAPVPAMAMIVMTRLDDRHRRRRHETAVVDQLPDLVDLLRLTTLAGLPVASALGAIGARPGGVVGDAVARAARLLDRGATTAQALAALGAACGDPVRNLVDALADHDRYGTPLASSLDRVAIECRLRRRRMAEEAARRVPVMLLFPLVLATLPAFALLTILPMVVGSFSSLQL